MMLSQRKKKAMRERVRIVKSEAQVLKVQRDAKRNEVRQRLIAEMANA